MFLIAHNTHYLEDMYSCEITLKKSDIIKALPSDYKQYITNIRLSIQTIDGTDYDNLEIDSKQLINLLSSDKYEVGKAGGEGEEEEEDEDTYEESLEILLPGWILNNSHQKVNVSDIITSISIHLLQPSTAPTPANTKGNKGKIQGLPQNALSFEHKLLLSTFRLNLSHAYSLSSLIDSEGAMNGDRSTMMTFYDNTVNSREPKPINTFLMFSTSDSDGINPAGGKKKIYFQLKVLSMKNVLISDTLTKSSDVYYLLYFTDDQGRKLSPLKSSTIDIVLPPSLSPLEALHQSSAALLQLPNFSTTLDAISRTLPTQEDCIFFRSEIKHLDINPNFNNTHVITEDIIRLYGLGKAMYLLMEVWDHNKTRSDVPLGEVFFPLVCGVKTGSMNGEGKTLVLPIQPSARMANYHLNNSSSNKVISDVGLGQVIVEITTSDLALTENRGSVKINENRKSINRNSLRSTPPKVHLPNPGPGLSQEEVIDLSIPVKLSLKQLHPTDRRWPVRFINSSASFVSNNNKGKVVAVNNDCYSQLFYADIQHDALVITPYFPVNNIIPPSSYDLLKIFSECFENKDRRKDYFPPPPPTSPLATLPQANDQISRPRLFSDEKQRNKHRKNHFFHQLFSFHKHSSSKKKDNHSNYEENKKAVPQLQRGNNINNKSRKGSASSDKINNPSGKRSSSIHEGKNNDIFRNICIEIDYDKILPDNISILSPNTLLIKISLKRLMSKPYKNGIQYEQKKIDYEFMIGPCPATEIYAYILAYMEMHQLRKCMKDLMIYPKQRSIPLIEVDTLHDNMIQKLHIINQEIENYEQEYFHNQDNNHHHHETEMMPAFTPHVTTPPTTSSTVTSYSPPHESQHVTWQLQYSWNTYFTPKHYLHGNFYSLLIMKLTLLGYYQYFLYITTYIDKYWLPDSASSTDDRLVNDDSMPTFNSYQTNYDDPMVIKALTNDMELKLRQISLNETSEQENTQLYIIANEIFVDLSFHIRMIYLFYHKKEQKERIQQLANEFNTIRDGVNDDSRMDLKKSIDNIIKQKKESRNIEIGLSIINQLIYQQYLQFIIYLKYAIEVSPNQTTNTPTTTPDSSSKQSTASSSTFLGFGKKSHPTTSNPTTQQQSSSSSGKSKFHHDLINFIITEDLILERYLFPYLNCHSYTFLHQPVLSKCIEFKQLIYEFIQYLDSSISYWNTTAIRNIMSGQTTLPNVKSPVKSEGGSGIMRGGSESVSRISLSDLRGASMNHQTLMRRKMTRKLSNALSPNNHPSSNTSRYRTMTSMRGHASSRYLYYQEKAKEEAAAVASYGYDRDTDNTVHSTVFPWSITLATIYPSNETLVQSDIPELIQIMLNMQIGTRKISSLSYERLSIVNIKRIFIINWKIAYALTRSYTTLLLSYRYYVNEIVKKMILNSMKTEKKFHLFISNYLTQRLKDFSHSHSPTPMHSHMHSHSEGVIQDITFTIQSIAATTANIITSSIPFSNTSEEDRKKEMKEEEEKKIQQQEIVDDLICFLLSMINDCIRIQQILIPETLDSFIQEYRYISNDLLLSSHHTKSNNSSKKHDSIGSDRGIRPVSDGSTSINDSNNTNNNYYSRVLSRRKSSMMKKSGNINDNSSNNNNNIAIKQFQYLFQKPLQLTTSIIHEIINHLCNQLFFYSDLKSYYMETIESFILLKGLSKKSQKSLFSNKYSYLQEKLSLHFQQLPKLLITPFFRSRTQSNLNTISHKKYLSSSLDDGDEEITGNVNNMSANNPNNSYTQQQEQQQEEEQREEIDATPMEVMMATLTEFYSFIGKFVQLPVLYEIIYHCMIKLVMRYLLLIRDISLNNKYRYEQKQSKLQQFITHAPEVVVSIPVGVAYGVIHTVPHLAKSLANAVTGERNTHNSTTTPSISEEGNLEEKMLKELEEEADDEEEEKEAASSGVYLKNAQLEQMKKDLQIIIQAHSQITDEKIHSLLRFLNMAIVDIWSSSSDQSDQQSMTFIDRLLIEQFKSSPPPYIPSDSYFLPSILSSSTSSSSSSAVYRQQLEQYLLDCNQFHDFTNEELMKENAKHFTIQVSNILRFLMTIFSNQL